MIVAPGRRAWGGSWDGEGGGTGRPDGVGRGLTRCVGACQGALAEGSGRSAWVAVGRSPRKDESEVC